QLPTAADVEVDLRELETVCRSHERLEPRGRGVRQVLARARDEETVRLLGSAADAPPELVQLSETETIGLLHDHDRRIRDVDTDLDHRGGDEHVELARLEAGHQLA